MPSGSAPNEHGDDLSALEHELAESISGLAARAKEVFFIEHLMGDFPICGCKCLFDFK
jgi:hypothetical protein